MQTIFRTAPDSPFVRITNDLVNTPMPYKAKEILIYLISKPINWRVKIADIRNTLALTTHTIRKSLQWLQSAGYAGYMRLKSGHTIWKIFDKPQSVPTNKPQSGASYNPDISPQTVSPHTAKPPLLETKEITETKETTTPVPALVQLNAPIPETKKAVVVNDSELIYPVQLNPVQKKAAKHVIKKVKQPELQKDILFALAYAMAQNKVKSPVAYLNGLITRANNGTFEAIEATRASNTANTTKPIIPIFTGHKQAHKIDNNVFFADLQKRFGSKATAAISVINPVKQCQITL